MLSSFDGHCPRNTNAPIAIVPCLCNPLSFFSLPFVVIIYFFIPFFLSQFRMFRWFDFNTKSVDPASFLINRSLTGNNWFFGARRPVEKTEDILFWKISNVMLHVRDILPFPFFFFFFFCLVIFTCLKIDCTLKVSFNILYITILI